MNELLNSVLESTDFLTPYLKQFAKYFDSSSIEPFENQSNLDGVLSIHTNEYENNIDDLVNIIDNILKEEGYVFFVIRNKTNILKSLEYHLLDKFTLVEEYISDDNWKFILYKKSTIK